jgi:hypothetical protein
MTKQGPKELTSTEMMRRTLLSLFFALIATASFAAPPPVNPADIEARPVAISEDGKSCGKLGWSAIAAKAPQVIRPQSAAPALSGFCG